MQGGNKFSQVPEWVLDADISDGAFRLYAALLRYAKQSTKEAFPARSTLAKRLRKNPKSIDRYIRELTEVGALKVQEQYKKGTNMRTSNLYTVVTDRPEVATSTSPPIEEGSDIEVATGRDTSVATGRDTDVAHNETHVNDTHKNEESAANATRPEPSQEVAVIQGELVPAEEPKRSNKSPEHLATDDAYEKTGKAFNFIATRGIAKWLIHDRGLTPERASDAIVAVYQMGKPITKQVLGQLIDGHLSNGGNRRPTTTDRINNTLAMGEELQAMLDQQRRAS